MSLGTAQNTFTLGEAALVFGGFMWVLLTPHPHVVQVHLTICMESLPRSAGPTTHKQAEKQICHINRAEIEKTPVFPNTFIHSPRKNVGLEDANRTTAYLAEGTRWRVVACEFDSLLVAPKTEPRPDASVSCQNQESPKCAKGLWKHWKPQLKINIEIKKKEAILRGEEIAIGSRGILESSSPTLKPHSPDVDPIEHFRDVVWTSARNKYPAPTNSRELRTQARYRLQDCKLVQCFARRGDERVDAHISVAPSAPTLLGLRRAKFHQLGGHPVSLLASHQGDTGSIPGWVIPGSRMWELWRTMPLFGGFPRGSPVFPALSFRRCSILTSNTTISSQDLHVKICPNLFPHYRVDFKAGAARDSEREANQVSRGRTLKEQQVGRDHRGSYWLFRPPECAPRERRPRIRVPSRRFCADCYGSERRREQQGKGCKLEQLVYVIAHSPSPSVGRVGRTLPLCHRRISGHGLSC
ncbi:hypothetical protein PR048_026349 [Dryococelus australis]|uniref:Uncharacterized protein n=1 Tax=Dryococelus australis TaxID=614101 RepID=A0ABQ9GL22_9NEOP|nr:hypothetical protein PR048_026349 [Dryococelus australis]